MSDIKEDLFREYLTREIKTIGTNTELNMTYSEVVKTMYDKPKPQKTGAEIAKEVIENAGLILEV